MIGTELHGEKVNLRPVRGADLLRRIEWLNDVETVRLFTGTAPIRVYGIEDANRWRESLEADETAILWAVETKYGRHIGDVDLHRIEKRDKSAKLTILLGDKAYWNSGYGTDTLRTLLQHAFSDLGLETVSLRVYDFNHRAIRCYEKSGFTQTVKYPGHLWPEPVPGEIYMVVDKDAYVTASPPGNPFADGCAPYRTDGDHRAQSY